MCGEVYCVEYCVGVFVLCVWCVLCEVVEFDVFEC